MAGPGAPEDAGFDIDQLSFVRLDPSEHEITDFECGDEDLNEFINSTEAATFQKERLGATTLVFHDQELVAYYTLAPSTLTKKEYAGDEHPDVEDLRDTLANLPSLLIGRFAVADHHQGEGLGRLLVEWVIAWALEQKEILFRLVILHAKGGAVCSMSDVASCSARAGGTRTAIRRSCSMSWILYWMIESPLHKAEAAWSGP